MKVNNFIQKVRKAQEKHPLLLIKQNDETIDCSGVYDSLVHIVKKATHGNDLSTSKVDELCLVEYDVAKEYQEKHNTNFAIQISVDVRSRKGEYFHCHCQSSEPLTKKSYKKIFDTIDPDIWNRKAGIQITFLPLDAVEALVVFDSMKWKT